MVNHPEDLMEHLAGVAMDRRAVNLARPCLEPHLLQESCLRQEVVAE